MLSWGMKHPSLLCLQDGECREVNNYVHVTNYSQCFSLLDSGSHIPRGTMSFGNSKSRFRTLTGTQILAALFISISLSKSILFSGLCTLSVR